MCRRTELTEKGGIGEGGGRTKWRGGGNKERLVLAGRVLTKFRIFIIFVTLYSIFCPIFSLRMLGKGWYAN